MRYKQQMMKNRMQNKVMATLLLGGLAVSLITGCGKGFGGGDTGTYEDITITIDPTEEIVVPNVAPKRQIPAQLPEVSEPAKTPGYRKHFTFPMGEKTYVFTETEELWMYNQSKIQGLDTQFLLNVDGNKVVIAPAEESVNLKDYAEVSSSDGVKIYRKSESEEVEEAEAMYLTLYDNIYQVTAWNKLVMDRKIKLADLYEKLGLLGTAVTPAKDNETLTDVLTGMSACPVFGSYKFAYRDGIAYSGYMFCSPNTAEAKYEDVSILMSLVVPEWDSYATVTVGAIPEFRDRLEDTGEKFGDYPIYVDYEGDLKYYILAEKSEETAGETEVAATKGEAEDASEAKEVAPADTKTPVTDVCVALDAIPGNATIYTDSYTPEEAKYLFSLFFTE